MSSSHVSGNYLIRTVFGLVIINGAVAALIALILWVLGVTGSFRATALTALQIVVYSCFVGIPAALLLPRLGPWISTFKFPVNGFLIVLSPIIFAALGSLFGGFLLVGLGVHERTHFSSTFLHVFAISGSIAVAVAVAVFTREFRRAGVRFWAGQ